jgi:hypothetical protein
MQNIKLDDIVKGIAEGMVFVLQKSTIPKDVINSNVIDINGLQAHILNHGSNIFLFKDKKYNINYQVNYQFDRRFPTIDRGLSTIDQSLLTINKINKTNKINETNKTNKITNNSDPFDSDCHCGINIYVYLPSFLSLGNKQMRFYGSNDKDIKDYIQSVNLTIKHNCTHLCTTTSNQRSNDIDTNFNCEIICDKINHTVNGDILIEMITQNKHDYRSADCLSFTKNGQLVNDGYKYLKDNISNTLMFLQSCECEKSNEKINESDGDIEEHKNRFCDDGTIEIDNLTDNFIDNFVLTL